MVQIDSEKLGVDFNKVKDYLQFYNQLGQPIIDEYSKSLDEKVDKINTYLSQIREYNLDFDVASLQKICIELSSILYYTSSRLEQVELLANMAKINYKSKYNDAYTSRQGAAKVEDRKYTTEQLKATAEQEAIEEELVSFIYDHVVSVLQSKIDAGYELLKACSKSLSGTIESMKQYGYSNKG